LKLFSCDFIIVLALALDAYLSLCTGYGQKMQKKTHYVSVITLVAIWGKKPVPSITEFTFMCV
jgi:hypothetical protein